MKLGIQIDKNFQKHLRKDWLRRVVEHSLAAQDIASEVELSLLITDDETMRKLNQEYRGVDESTDVLSFALAERKTGNNSPPFVEPPDGLLHLGEVVISYPQAARQAEENNHQVEEEIALLVIHGILHLLGYEHDEPAREREMRGLEERILSGLLKNVGTPINRSPNLGQT